MASDIGEWLDGLGLGRYAEAFADNEIDLHALPHITEEDLKQVGIALGARRQLLSAIAELGDLDEPATADERSDKRSASAEAERRQLTVMFCDLVGSTALAEWLDPEDLRDVIRAYQETCAEAVERFEGHIAKYIGDGLLVYFGYPQAHEDDARRAVMAGLGIVAGLDTLNRRLGAGHGVELSVRVGIHTGFVIVGEMGGGETREADAIVGRTPNVAARLEGLAEPNTVAISAATQRLVVGLFDYDDLGPQELKGVSKPVRIFRVLGESAARSRFEAAVERGLTPLVGREEEVALISKRWEQARDGESQVVVLSGEAGVGKSRIVRAVRERLEGEPHSRILYYCSPYHQNSALYPVIDQFERILRFARDDGPAQKLDKLEAALENIGLAVAETAPLFASLHSIPADGRYPPLELAPEQLKARTLEAIVSVFQAMAAQAPVLIVLEDAHWIDPSSVELLGLAIARLSAARVLMIITCRPEFEPPWASETHFSSLALNRLGRRDAAAMVANVTGRKALPSEVLNQIIARTDGVPLYVEELTKTVLESGVLKEEGDGYVLTGPLPPFAIPASLQDSLMARLDRLAPVKEVAQLAAVLGRMFERDLLAAASPLGGGDLDNALEQLVGAGLVYRRGLAPNETFEFKHALVQEAAYHSLLKTTRQQHHARVAQVIEERFPETTETQPELLARHFFEAGLAEAAVPHFHRAGQRAAERSANLEAIAHLAKGIELLATLPDTPERAKQELALQIALGPAIMASRGFMVSEVERAYLRARELSRQLRDEKWRFTADWGLWLFNTSRARHQTARGLVGDLRTTAEHKDDPALHLQTCHAAWTTDLFLGRFGSSRDHSEQGRGLYDSHEHRAHKFLYGGHDPGVCGRSFGGMALCLLGYPDQAVERANEAVALAEQLAHPNSAANALCFAAFTNQILRDLPRCGELADAAVALAKEHGNAFFLMLATHVRGYSLAQQGLADKGIEMMRQVRVAMDAAKLEMQAPYFRAQLAETLGQVGQAEQGLSLLDEALAIVEHTDEQFFEAEIHRLRGELLLSRSARSKTKAEAAFRQAIETAGGQEAKLLELRAATSLARLWGENTKRAEARELLAPVYGWFAEGFDTPDLKDAKALLDELR